MDICGTSPVDYVLKRLARCGDRNYPIALSKVGSPPLESRGPLITQEERLEVIQEEMDAIIEKMLISKATCGTFTASSDARKAQDDYKVVYSSTVSMNDTIFMCKQSIIEIFPSIKNLYCTKILYGCCNHISVIPKEIRYLKKLKFLVLSNNRIGHIPEDIGECESLVELNLSSNKLSGLPSSMANLKKLEVINLKSNMFSDVPMCLSKIRGLRSIDVSNNSVRAIPIEIARLENIIRIETSGNPMLREPVSMCKGKIIGLSDACARIYHQMKGFGEDASGRIAEDFMAKVNYCSVCRSPFFQPQFEYVDMQICVFDRIPVSYNMCMMHFEKKLDKIRMLFSI